MGLIIHFFQLFLILTDLILGLKPDITLRRPRKIDGMGEFRPMARPRSRVIHKSPSPQPELANRQLSSQETIPKDEDSNQLRIKSEEMNVCLFFQVLFVCCNALFFFFLCYNNCCCFLILFVLL